MSDQPSGRHDFSRPDKPNGVEEMIAIDRSLWWRKDSVHSAELPPVLHQDLGTEAGMWDRMTRVSASLAVRPGTILQ